MSLFEFDSGHLVPAQFGRATPARLEDDMFEAVRAQGLELVGRPLFPVVWGQSAQSQLLSMDAAGQGVTVDDVNIEHLSKGHKRGSEVDISHIFSEPIIPRAALQDGPASYVALSHIHARQKMGTKCYYAGSPNRITFTDADDPKSVNLVKITDGNELAAVDYLDTDARIMTSISLVDPDAEKRLDALEEGALVRLVLPPGEPDAPDSVRAAIREAGAILATTQTTPQDRPRLTATTLPEKISPLSALDSWLDERAPDVDRAYVKDLATRIAEQVEHP